MDFQYFLPNATAAPETLIEALGLRAMLGPVPYAQRPITSGGPGGTGGVVIAADPPGRGASPSYQPEGWRWIPARSDRQTGTEPPYWLGVSTTAPPTPAELVRPWIVPGEGIELGDGNVWTVPQARLASRNGILMTGLPLAHGLSDDGEEITTIAAEYARLWDLAGEVWATCICVVLAQVREQGVEGLPDEPPPAEPMTPEREREIATAALAANYRVGRAEVLALGLLETRTTGAILRALVDFGGWQKLWAEGNG